MHCEYLPASTVVRDFEQHTMMTHVNEAISALSIDPSAGYNNPSNFVKFYIVFVMISMFIVAAGSLHVHTFVITNSLLFFLTKFNMKMPIHLT